MEYWGTTDICKAFHVSRAAVHKWRSTGFEGFPEPLAIINDDTNPVWDAGEVRKWREKTMRDRRLNNKSHQKRLAKKKAKRGTLKRRSARKPRMSEKESRELTARTRKALSTHRTPTAKPPPATDYGSMVDDILKR